MEEGQIKYLRTAQEEYRRALRMVFDVPFLTGADLAYIVSFRHPEAEPFVKDYLRLCCTDWLKEGYEEQYREEMRRLIHARNRLRLEKKLAETAQAPSPSQAASSSQC